MIVITNIMFVFLLLVIASLLAIMVDAIVTAIRKTNKSQSVEDKISFMESMNLSELPVITFNITNSGDGLSKFNFMLDTGSSRNHINSALVDKIKYIHSGVEESVSGFEGTKISGEIVNIDVFYKDKKYSDEFMLTDLNDAFNIIKQDSGVQIHGILGSSFFQKYKYILDFNELVAYSKI